MLIVPRPGFFGHLHWNWLGKLLEIFISLALIVAAGLSFKQAGVRRANSISAYAWGVSFAIIFSSFHIYSFSRGAWASQKDTDVESILYQLSMPGVAEEIFYRGLLLAIFDRYLSKPWNIFGVQLGFGWILTSILFVVVHIVEVDPTMHIEVYTGIPFILFLAFAGLAWGWLRGKGESVWPAALSHDLLNSFRYIGSRIHYL